MLEGASLLSFFLAFALLHGAAPNRLPLKRTKAGRTVFTCMRTAAVVTAGAGVVLWSRTQNATTALLVAIAALSMVATVFVLLAPLFPRAVWALVIACLPLTIALALLGGSNG